MGQQSCVAAASFDQLDVLRWLRTQNPPCQWSEEACEEAARDGRLDVLQWLRSQTPPCPWSEDVF